MDDPKTFWLVLTNWVMGAAVLAGLVTVVFGVVHDVIVQRARRRVSLRRK